MKKFFNRLFFALLLLLVVAGAALAILQYVGYEPLAFFVDPPLTPEQEADLAEFDPGSSFITDQDGFRFLNFLGSHKEGDLTIEDVRAMFGDDVCRRFEDGRCIGHPLVNEWIETKNLDMNTFGHCVGFTVISSQLHSEVASARDFGADTTYSLDTNVPVLRAISRGYAANYASSVQTQVVKDKTPRDVVEALLLLDEPVDIGLYYPKYPDNGHSVLGHDVVYRGNDIYHIKVYDSNYPGKDGVIVVDVKENTWFYEGGAVNPNEETADFEGDARTKSLTFIPLSAYSESLSCPPDFDTLCRSVAEPGRLTAVTVTGSGDALAETADGQIGTFGDTVVNTVPGGDLVPVRGAPFSRQAPILLIPSAESFELTAPADERDTLRKIFVANSGFSVAIDGLTVRPGQIDRLNYDPGAQQTTYVAGGDRQPVFELLFTQSGEEYLVQLLNLAFSRGQDLSLTVDAGGNVVMGSSTGLVNSEATVMVVRLSSNDEAVFSTVGVEIVPNSDRALDVGSWDGSGPMRFLNDEDGDGRVDTADRLENMPLPDVLKAVDGPATVVNSLQSLVHYLDRRDRRDVEVVLPTLGLSGPALGETYLILPDLRPDNLPDVIDDTGWSSREIGRFTAALNLDDEEAENLLDDLGLDGNQKVDALSGWRDWQAVEEAIREWEFINNPDNKAVTRFVEDKGLTDEQAKDFLELVERPLQIASVSSLPQPTATPRPTETSLPTATTRPTETPRPANTATPIPEPTVTEAPPSILLTGQVVDAITGLPLTDAQVCVIQDPLVCDSVDDNGAYVFTGSVTRDLLVEASAPGYTTQEQVVSVSPDATITKNFPLSPPLAEGNVRIVLSWGESPTDVDAYLWVPATDTNESYRLYYGTQGASDEFPFAQLDTDAQEQFGVETITIYQRHSGTYTYYVNNFSQDGTLASALVQVYGPSGLIEEFTPPQGQNGVWWDVFELDGETGLVTPLNTMRDE